MFFYSLSLSLSPTQRERLMEQRRVYGTQNPSTSNAAPVGERKRKMTLQTGRSDRFPYYSYGTPNPSTSDAATGERKRKITQDTVEQPIKVNKYMYTNNLFFKNNYFIQQILSM